ncbi:hypothetical protein D3C83_245230 [compost metagenome]
MLGEFFVKRRLEVSVFRCRHSHSDGGGIAANVWRNTAVVFAAIERVRDGAHE